MFSANNIEAQSSLAKSSLAEQEMQSLQRQVNATSDGMSAAKEKKLRQACEGFEAVFIQKMWENMRSSLPKEGLMHSKEEQFWQGMYDQELGKSIAASGGIGLADMMMSQLTRKLQNASATAAMRNSRVHFNIAPAPLVPDSTAKQQASKPAAPLYEGEAVQPQVESEPQPVAKVETPPVAAPVSPVKDALKELAADNSQTAPTSVVHTYQAGQKPKQDLNQLAASLAAESAQKNNMPVHVTMTRQVNSPKQTPNVIRRQAASAYAAQQATPQNTPSALVINGLDK